MNDAPHPALLPAGLYDLLPPDAEIEAELTARLMGVLASHGYQRVKPPLVEFEETLLSGAEGPAADVEAIAVAGEALQAVGVPHLSVDLTLPTLVPAIVEAYGLGGAREAALRAALDHKDTAAVAGLAGEAGLLLAELIASAGIAAATRAALDRLDLPARARQERDRLGAVLDGLATAVPALKVTVDPVENRGFEYHTGIAFTFFARVGPELGPLGELGRGGRYQAGDPEDPEPATGFTLYTDTILRTLPAPPPRRRVLVPPDIDRARARALR